MNVVVVVVIHMVVRIVVVQTPGSRRLDIVLVLVLVLVEKTMTTTKDRKENDETTLETASASISMDGSIRTVVSHPVSKNGHKAIIANTTTSSMLRTDPKKSKLKMLDSSNDSDIDKPNLVPSLLRTSDSRKDELDILRPKRNSDHAKKLLSEELTINKLDLKSLGLIGRDQELSTLRSSFSRLRPNQGETASPSDPNTEAKHKELVFIRGYSGIGKSTLAQSLRKDILSSEGAYVEGKYEFTSIDMPYFGLAQIFGGLCNKIKDSSSDVLAKVAWSINNAMKEEAEMLKDLLIPELCIFLNNGEDCKSVQSRQSAIGSDEHERWKQAFRMLTRILSLHFSTIVMVLDDLQWADAPSLDIMECLISDVENPYPLMIIGCYRSNEVDENSILYNRIQTLQEKQDKFGFRISDIELQNLDANAINTIVMAMLSIDDKSKTKDLSTLCFKRTSGNPFFLIEYMKMLQREDLIDFNLGLMKWVWDVSEIEDTTMSTANVVDLLQGRMMKLPEEVQLLLQYAACLGSSFSLSILKYAWDNSASVPLQSAKANFTAVVEALKQENLVETCGPEEYRWVHDKVQEAALSLSDLVTPSFQFDLGICLYEGLDEPQLRKQLFNVADLVNKGKACARLNLSQLNLRAAKKAQKMAAFQSGAQYASSGIKFLPPKAWVENRKLVIDLYSAAAEMNVSLGNIDAAKELIQTVLGQKEYTPMEKIRLATLKLEILGSVEFCHGDALNYGLQLSNKIGYSFVWWRKLVPLQAMALVWKTVKRLKKLPLHYFENTRLMKDPKQAAAMNLLTILDKSAYLSEQIFYSFLCTCKSVELTLDHGLHHLSAGKVARLANVVMMQKNDHGTANHLCDIAFTIQKRFGRRGAADTVNNSVAFTLGCTKPLHELLPLTLEGYSQGIRDGDTFFGIWCFRIYYSILCTYHI